MRRKNEVVDLLEDIKSDSQLSQESAKTLDTAIEQAKINNKTARRNALFLYARVALDYFEKVVEYFEN